MSIDPTRFTRPSFTLKDFIDLIGADRRAYCTKVQPNECRGKSSKNLEQECSKIFQDCMEFTKHLECWHRTN